MKWGKQLAVLLAALVLMGLAACAPKDGPLTEKELAEWEERLNTPEWSAFLSHLYSDVKYLNLSRVFAAGAGLAQSASDGTMTVAAEEMEALLQQRTGQTLDDLRDTLSDWTYLEDSDSYRGQAREPEAAVTVTAGERREGVVTLQTEREGEEPAFLTLSREEKILSYTNDQYNAVEAMALDLLAQTVRRVESGGGTVEGAYISYLKCTDQSEDGYYLWDVDYRIQTERGERLSAMEAETVNGWFTARTDRGAPRFVVEKTASGEYTLVATLYSGDTSGMTWQEYVDFVMEQGIDNADLNNGWPQLNEDMLTALASGGRQWALSREGVISAYLWQQGDEPAGWETVSVREGSGQWMDQHSVVSVETVSGNRSYTLLLSHRNVPYAAGEQETELSVWQITGSSIQGESLPAAEMPDSDAAARLTAFEEKLTEGESAYLAQGGGTYADYRWSVCVPTAWSRSGERWYPDGEDLTAYLEVRDHDADYSDAAFYASFANSFSRVRSNYGWGGETAWVRGESGRGQVTEAFLCRSGEEVWEVMWTYPSGGDSSLLSAVAATFRCGDAGVTELGQAPRGPLLVEDRDDTWMVLGSFRACALGEVLLDDGAAVLKPYQDAYYTYTFSQPKAEEIEWVGTYPGKEGNVELFRIKLAVKAEPPGPEVPLDPARPADDLPVDDSGFWHPEEPVWLAVEHDGETFLAVTAFHASAKPGEDAFRKTMDQALEAAGGTSGGREMYLNPETGKISASRWRG